MIIKFNPKERTQELQVLATQILTTSGADVTQGVAIRPLAKALAKRTGCSYQTAIRHIEQAILRARGNQT